MVVKRQVVHTEQLQFNLLSAGNTSAKLHIANETFYDELDYGTALVVVVSTSTVLSFDCFCSWKPSAFPGTFHYCSFTERAHTICDYLKS